MIKFRDISFSTIRKMDISKVFTKWIKLLFTGATGCNIYLNDNSGENFKVEKWVRQVCPLAPYFFFIVGEVHIIKKNGKK